jgi:methionyl-tRNA formyltransferase
LRIAFAGTPEFAVPALDALVAAGHDLVGVLTQPDRPAGRGRVLTASAVKERALQLGLPLAQPERLANEPERAALWSWRPELLVVVAYGLILPRAALDLPRLGCLNIHASLLPRWRGAAPIQRALLAGDAETGVAVMGLETTLDTGPIFAERRLAISARDCAVDLQPRLAALGAAALIEVIGALQAGTARPLAQGADGVTYAHKIAKQEALIDWHGNATAIARQVRAFNPWPVAETLLQHQRVRIWRAIAADDSKATSAEKTGSSPGRMLGLRDGALLVKCGAGVLAIESLQLPGKRPISAEDFAHTHELQGLQFGALT